MAMIEKIKIYLALWRVRQVFRPRRGLRRELWLALRSELPAQRPLSFPLRLARATAPVGVVILAFGGVSAYAYSSPTVTPDHPLYGVKRAVEQVEAATALTPRARVAAQLRRMEHRLAEAEALAADRPEPAIAVLDDLNHEIADVTVASSVAGAAPPLAEAVEEVDSQVLTRLEQLAVRHPENVLPRVQQLIVDDAKLVQRRLPGLNADTSKKVLEQRLERRQAAIKNVFIQMEELNDSSAEPTVVEDESVDDLAPKPQLPPDMDEKVERLWQDAQSIDEPPEIGPEELPE